MATVSEPLPNPATLADVGPLGALASRLAGEMARRWRQGERPLTEEFLVRHPELREHPPAALKLVCEEICLRQEHGEELPSVDVVGRFPQWESQLGLLLGCHRLLKPVTAEPVFPAAGEMIAGFHLVQLVGQGAAGRVFLATDPALADRPMVLKLTACAGQEHLALARLQHTHIAPLYLSHDDTARDLRILCMPYFGGASLAAILKNLKRKTPAQRSGRDLLKALDQAQAHWTIACPAVGPARQYFSRSSYAEAVCWIGACLADALQYAHERGVIHLDLKPSNVLLAADGQPLLLDFHLARGPAEAGSDTAVWFGGTPGYMSPEQEAAFEAIQAGRLIPRAVDARSDIYSLGLLLYEALGGTRPAGQQRPARLDRCNRQVSTGLADILAKCLAEKPRARYPDAAALATDLRRHLSDLPLRGVANRSLTERWRKWRRRRPRALLLTLLLAVASGVATGVAGVWWNNHRLHEYQAEQALVAGQEQLEGGQYADALRTLERGLEFANALPAGHDLNDKLAAQRERARQAALIQELHRLADQVRLLYDSDVLPPERLRALETQCEAVWQSRQEFVAPLVGADQQQVLRTDLLDLAVLSADLHVRLATPEQVNTARRQALARLAEAEDVLGASNVLCRQRQTLAQALGLRELAETAARQAAALPPRSAWELYLLGRSLLREGKLLEAAAALERAAALEPHNFWVNFSQGSCAYRRGHFDEAVQAFRVCVALAPAKAECYYNRGLAYQSLGRLPEARADYGRALELKPSLSAASFNRGVIYCTEKRYGDGIAELQRALHDGFDPALVHFNVAVAYESLQERPAAVASLQKAIEHRPDYPQARELLEQLRRAR